MELQECKDLIRTLDQLQSELRRYNIRNPRIQQLIHSLTANLVAESVAIEATTLPDPNETGDDAQP